MNSGDNILLTDLLVQSISEEYDIDEGKVKDFLKKTIGPVAVGTAAALSTLGPGKEIKSVSPRSSYATAPTKEINKESMPFSELLLRQAYKESRFKPSAMSRKGAKGLSQIMPSTLKGYIMAKRTDPSKVNLDNPKHSAEIQKWAMKRLYNLGFIKGDDKRPENIRRALTLAAYNYGEGNLKRDLDKLERNVLNGIEWIKSLPKETQNYVNTLLKFKEDPTFEKNFEKAKKDNPEVENLFKDVKTLNELKKTYA